MAHDPAVTTIDRLDSWKAAGTITDAQHVTLSAIVRRERFSVFVELSALLYIGVLSVVAGLAWTFRDYVADLGDAVILSILLLLTTVSLGYSFFRVGPYSNGEVQSPSLGFDYVLYFGCLMFSATLAFIEVRFGIFQGWEIHLLIASGVFGALAYRFDNRFVLSLALSTLAAYLGLSLNVFDTLDGGRLPVTTLMYGAFLIGVGVLLARLRIKPHFLDVFLHLGANAMLLGAFLGGSESWTSLAYLGLLLILSSVAIYLGVRFSRFAFVAYGTLYGYVGVSLELLGSMSVSSEVAMAYFVVTGLAVVIGLVALARRVARA